MAAADPNQLNDLITTGLTSGGSATLLVGLVVNYFIKRDKEDRERVRKEEKEAREEFKNCWTGKLEDNGDKLDKLEKDVRELTQKIAINEAIRGKELITKDTVEKLNKQVVLLQAEVKAAWRFIDNLKPKGTVSVHRKVGKTDPQS